MNQNNTTDDVPGWKEVLLLITLKLIFLPAIILGLFAAVTLNIGQTLSEIRPVPDGTLIRSFSNPPDWIIVIAVGCGILLLYGHFFTDHPVWQIATGKYRHPERPDK